MEFPDDETIKRYMKKYGVRGAACGFFQGGVLERECYHGSSLQKPVTRHTLFEAASLTKPLFAFYFLKNMGKWDINLQTPLLEVVPDYPIRYLTYQEKINAKHVLCHSSGLPDWSDKPLPVLFKPGTGFHYSGEGYTLLQEAVEMKAGASVGDLFEKKLLPELSMEHSTMSYASLIKKKAQDDVAVCYDRDGKPQTDRYRVRDLTKEPNVAFSLYTNVQDYGAFLLRLFHQKEIFKLMSTKVLQASNEHDGLFYGLGLGIYKKNNKTYVWHYGDNVNFKNLFLLDADTGDGFVLFTNSFHGLQLCYRLSEHIFDLHMEPIQKFAETWK